MTLISDIKLAMEKNKINNTVIKVLNPEHGKKVIEYFKSLGVDTRNYEGSKNERDGHNAIYYGVIQGAFDNYWFKDIVNKASIIELPTEESKAYEKQSLAFETPKHYNNQTSTGTLYNVATIRNWNAYLFDIVKRLERAEEKGEFDSDLEKSINVIKLWKEERNKNK